MAEIFKDPRKREYLNAEGADKPLRSPIPKATLVKARGYRKRRLIDKLAEHDCAAILLYDPVNIRYALDVSNMQLWMTHNASHYALVCADGHAIAFEYGKSEHVAKGIETVDEVRTATTWFYFSAGNRLAERVEKWADEIADIVRQRGGGNMRLAADKVEPAGVDALRKRGITIVEGQEMDSDEPGVEKIGGIGDDAPLVEKYTRCSLYPIFSRICKQLTDDTESITSSV